MRRGSQGRALGVKSLRQAPVGLRLPSRIAERLAPTMDRLGIRRELLEEVRAAGFEIAVYLRSDVTRAGAVETALFPSPLQTRRERS